MEKENVLEIEITKINSEYSAFYQTKIDIDKLIEISDGKALGDGEYIPYITLRMDNCVYNIYLTRDEVFPQVIKNIYIEELKQKIEEINKEFEVSKRWRAEEGGIYWFIDSDFTGKVRDLWDRRSTDENVRYNLGNYFKTKEEAEKVKEELDKFWAKVRAGEIGGDE